MSLTSHQKFLKNIKDSLKSNMNAINASLDELSKFIDNNPDYINQFRITDNMMVETGPLLSQRINRTAERLLEQIDVIIEGKDKLPSRNKVVPVQSNDPAPDQPKKRGRKKKASPRR